MSQRIARRTEMLSDELEDTVADPSQTWRAKARRNLRKRWVQVVLVLLGGLVAMAISTKFLAPKKPKSEADPKFLFCPKCEAEERYEKKMDGEPCRKCTEEPVGTLIGQAKSIKDVGMKSPWKWVYVAIILESLVTLGAMVLLLSLSTKDLSNSFYVFYCPHCSQRLRFRHVSLGGLGQCSRCKRPVRFPTEEQAVPEEVLLKEEERRAAEEEELEDDEDG